MPDIAVVIPWRSKGDPDRDKAFTYTYDYYRSLPLEQVIVTSDGNDSGPFNRHRAYNLGYAQTDADVVLWNEADTLIPLEQIEVAADAALSDLGLVIPYTERHELDAAISDLVYAGSDPFDCRGAIVYPDGRSIGQAGVTSRATMDAIGGRWPEQFTGWGYDDNAAFHIFATLAGPPRWVQGKGMHLWHLPEHQKPRTAETDRNAALFQELRDMSAEQLRQHLIAPHQ